MPPFHCPKPNSTRFFSGFSGTRRPCYNNQRSIVPSKLKGSLLHRLGIHNFFASLDSLEFLLTQFVSAWHWPAREIPTDITWLFVFGDHSALRLTLRRQNFANTAPKRAYLDSSALAVIVVARKESNVLARRPSRFARQRRPAEWGRIKLGLLWPV